MQAIHDAHAAQFAARCARSNAYLTRIFFRARADAQLDFGLTRLRLPGKIRIDDGCKYPSKSRWNIPGLTNR